MQKTIIYVDGFNLYYCLLKQHPQYKWVNLKTLVQTVLGPAHDIIQIRYFTADVTGKLDKDAPKRQKIYLNALETLDEIFIHKGDFLSSKKWAGLVHSPDHPPKFKPELVPPLSPPWPDVVKIHKTEEKGSDVNLASYLLLDAFQNRFDLAAIITNDTDLATPIRMTTENLGKSVALLSPVSHPHQKLKQFVKFTREIQPRHLSKSQFSDEILHNGKPIKKPAEWV